jgi:hypothetical protein
MSCTKSWDDFRQGRTAAHQSSFFFEIPISTTLPTASSDQKINTPDFTKLPNSLPPSLKISSHADRSRNTTSSPSKEIEGSCQVTYTISARIFLNDDLITHTSREIVVFPTAAAPPPLNLNHCGSEYALSDSSLLSRASLWDWTATSRPRVQVTICEPTPFLIQPPEDPNVASTELHLRFTLYDAESHLPELSGCCATISLEATTHFSTTAQRTVLSLAEIKTSKDVLAMKGVINVEQQILELGPWEWFQEEGVWQTTASIRTLAPDRLRSLPSFFAALVSRRFAFSVDLELRGKKGGNLLSRNLTTRVPVQVALAPIEFIRQEVIEGLVDGVVEPPLYIA